MLYDSREKITDLALKKTAAKLFPADTVLMAMYGDGKTITSLGLLCRDAATIQACCAMIPNKSICEPRFLFYALKFHRDDFLRLASGGAQRNLSGKIIRKFAINSPPFEEQRAIAEILGALDDRIENLRQTNATLQAIAATLFKSWFVDFDSVPQEDMQESELGLIPKGWRVGTFDEVIEILGGGTPKTSVAEYWNGDIPWFSVVDAPASGQVFVLETERQITKVGLSKCSAKLLPEMTTIISARGTVGKVALTGVPMTINQSCYALRPRQQNGDAFVYFFTIGFVEHLQRIAHGAVFDTITRDSFKRVTALLPTDEIVSKFGEIANPLLQRIRANGLQGAALAALRDTLLPRLISGRLRISETARENVEVTA
jgi:type I restriction enzyme S subunit